MQELGRRMSCLGARLRELIIPPDRWQLRVLDDLDIVEVKFQRGDGERRFTSLMPISVSLLTDSSLKEDDLADYLVRRWHFEVEHR